MKFTLINEVLEIDNTTQEKTDNAIITDKAIAIQDNNLIYLLKTFTKGSNIQSNEIIYGI